MKPLFLVGLLALVAGCNPLFPVSSAPPMTQGSHQYPMWENDLIRITQGVVIAVRCRSVWSGMPCEEMTVTSDDPSIARVSFVHLDKYRSSTGLVYDAGEQRSAFLVAGVKPGKTTIRVGGEDADETIDVFVNPL